MQLLPIITSEISKSDLKAAVLDTVAQLKETGNAMQLTDLLTKIDFYIKELKANKEYIELTREEVGRSGNSVTLPSGTKIELAEVGIKYDYSQCNDPEIKDLEERLERLEAKIKDRHTYLKALPLKGVPYITDDGELLTIFPPAKSSTSSIKTTLAK